MFFRGLGLGFRVLSLGFWVWVVGLGSWVQGSRGRLGFRVWNLRFRFEGFDEGIPEP